MISDHQPPVHFEQCVATLPSPRQFELTTLPFQKTMYSPDNRRAYVINTMYAKKPVVEHMHYDALTGELFEPMLFYIRWDEKATEQSLTSFVSFIRKEFEEYGFKEFSVLQFPPIQPDEKHFAEEPFVNKENTYCALAGYPFFIFAYESRGNLLGFVTPVSDKTNNKTLREILKPFNLRYIKYRR